MGLNVPEEADRHYEIGLGLLRTGDDKNAEREFTKAIDMWSEHTNARYYRSEARFGLNDSSGAFEDLLHLIRSGILSEPICRLMARLTHENGPWLWIRKANDSTDGRSLPKEPLRAILPSEEDPDDIDDQTSFDLRLEAEGEEKKRLRDAKRQLARFSKTEIIEGQVKSLAIFHSNKTLSDVIGLEKAKRILRNNVILPLQKPRLIARYKKKGGLKVLFYGPPGCGKTLLAEALSGEIRAVVVVARIHELIDMYTGNSEKNIHALFEQAREIAAKTGKPVIIFIDEIDGLGVKRDASENHQSMRLAVNHLMMELDGIEKTEGLIVIGATNQPWAVDPALKRSGRFGNCIYVPPPDFEQRKKIFEQYLKGKPTERIDLDELAHRTVGYSAADLERIVDTAIERPIEREDATGKRDKLTMQDILNVLEDLELGGNTLDEWFANVEKEIERDPRDKVRFKPLLEDLKKHMERKRAEESQRQSSIAV